MLGNNELNVLSNERERAYQKKQEAWIAQDNAWRKRQQAHEIMDQAYASKQTAYEVQDNAWRKRDKARDEMDRAYQIKQEAHGKQQEAWDAYQCVRQRKVPQIEELSLQQEEAYQNMRDAFEKASDAHNARDGASAREYADEGHCYKEQARECVEERRELQGEINQAKAEWEETRAPFQVAKEEFEQARNHFAEAKTEHEQAQREFKTAQAEFDKARKDFQTAKHECEDTKHNFSVARYEADRINTLYRSRIEEVHRQREQRKADNLSLIDQAGIPYCYRDNVHVSKQPDGTVNLYFGGIGRPDGPGHGHYVLDPSGDLTYAREPYEEHGAHNFSDYKELGDNNRGFKPVPGESATTENPANDGKQKGCSPTFTSAIIGTNSEGDVVTVAFGQNEAKGQTLLSDGMKGQAEFTGKSKARGHDHYDGQGGGTNRGKYTGEGS